MLEVVEGVQKIKKFIGVTCRLKAGKTLPSLPQFLARRQVRCNDTVIGANEPSSREMMCCLDVVVILMTEAKVATTTRQTTHHILLPPEGGRDQLITDC